MLDENSVPPRQLTSVALSIDIKRIFLHRNSEFVLISCAKCEEKLPFSVSLFSGKCLVTDGDADVDPQ